jgi:hypothetical protein
MYNETQNLLLNAFPKGYWETVKVYVERVSKETGEAISYIHDLYYNRAKLSAFARQHLIHLASVREQSNKDDNQLNLWGDHERNNHYYI